MIGITGATGHLGSVLLDMLPDSEPIGRTIPDRPYEAIIHTAAPNYRDAKAVLDFRDYNRALEDHVRRHRPQVLIVTGSWWQHADGNCRDLLYTMLKNEQARTFREAIHVLPYSIYGEQARPGRGFVPQLIDSIRWGTSLKGLSAEPRDFIHVTDVALAHIRALDAPRGTYLAATGYVTTPRDLAHRYGVTGPDYLEPFNASPTYLAPPVPGWTPTVTVDEHIAARI